MSDAGTPEGYLAKIEELTRERDAYAQALSTSNAAFSQKVKEFSIVKRIGDLMIGNFDEKNICTEIVDVIIDETSTENCSLWLVDDSRSYVELKAAKGQEDDEVHFFPSSSPSSTRLPLGEGVAGRVALHGTSLVIKDADHSPLFLKKESKRKNSIKSLLCMPIIGEKGVIGVINMSHPQIGVFTRENERSIALITTQAAQAFTNYFLFEKIQKFSEHLESVVQERTRDLQYSETKYRSFVENAGDGIVICQKDSLEITDINSRACEYTGYIKEELVGKRFDKVAGEELQSQLRKVLSTGSGSVNGVPIIQRSGALLYVDITVNTIRTIDETLAHLIIRDITHRRQLETRLKEYSERLEELVEKRTSELKMAQGELLIASKMAAIGELASGVAHEINNPLAIISGYAEDLIDNLSKASPDKLDIESITKSLAIITEQADRCQKITGSLLDFTRKQEISSVPIDITYVIRQAVTSAKQRVKTDLIKFDFDFENNPPLVSTDPQMVEQVLLNIYNNAVDAIGEAGVVFTRVEKETHGVSIYVSDTGGGIPQDIADNIFNPFFTTKKVGKGTGLGLSICLKLMERLQGTISVENMTGKGATFKVFVPDIDR